MKLDHEDRSHRRYLAENGDYIEVRPVLRALRAETAAKNIDIFPEVGETMRRMLVEGLLRRAEQDGFEPFSDVDLRLDRFEHIIYLTDEETGEILLGPDGEPIIDPEFPDPVEMVSCTAEVGCWPPAPKEPS
jgi:hypothetical protein